MNGSRELLRLKHFLVTVDDDTRIVTRVRTAERFDSGAELETAYEQLLGALDSLDRPSHAQLVDVRLAPARNDPQFEAVVTRYHPRLYGGFRANAVLHQSAVGALQIKRIVDATGVSARTFTDEVEARRFLIAAVGVSA
jgi:hypothetical protein